MGQGSPLHSSTTRAAQDRRWHNKLPAWIEHDLAWGNVSVGARSLLQVIADACDAPDHDSHLIGAFGGAEYFSRMTGLGVRTYWKHIHRLMAHGFLVLLARGGNVRLHVRGGSFIAGNTYGIPGSKGGLNHRRAAREVVQVTRSSDGRMTRETLQPGDQASFWPRRDTSAMHNRHGPHAQSACPPCRNGMVPTHIPSPIPPPVRKNHEAGCARDGGFAARRGKKHPEFGEVDLRDDRRLVALFFRFREAGWVSDSDVDTLWFFAAVEHALRVAKKSPCGLLVSLLRNRGERSLFVTAEDEERAVRRLRSVRA